MPNNVDVHDYPVPPKTHTFILYVSVVVKMPRARVYFSQNSDRITGWVCYSISFNKGCVVTARDCNLHFITRPSRQLLSSVYFARPTGNYYSRHRNAPSSPAFLCFTRVKGGGKTRAVAGTDETVSPGKGFGRKCLCNLTFTASPVISTQVSATECKQPPFRRQPSRNHPVDLHQVNLRDGERYNLQELFNAGGFS